MTIESHISTGHCNNHSFYLKTSLHSVDTDHAPNFTETSGSISLAHINGAVRGTQLGNHDTKRPCLLTKPLFLAGFISKNHTNDKTHPQDFQKGSRRKCGDTPWNARAGFLQNARETRATGSLYFLQRPALASPTSGEGAASQHPVPASAHAPTSGPWGGHVH